MQQHSDEALVAYLDGELDDDERARVEAWLEAEPAVRDRLLALSDSAGLLRGAYAEFANEPVPERLIAAARSRPAESDSASRRSRTAGSASSHASTRARSSSSSSPSR